MNWTIGKREKTILLTQLDWGEGKNERREGKKEGVLERERESTFSLDFSVISPSNPGETRGKVDPHYKSYAWVPVLWSFDKLREIGVFSYLVISCLKIHEMVLGVVRPEMAMDSRFHEVEQMLDEGVVPGQPTDLFGTI